MRRLAQVTRMSPADILNSINVAMVRDAYKHGMGTSAYLERLNPTEPGDTSGLDAFERVLREAGIYTRSIEGAGIHADVYEDVFDGSEQRRLLGIEFLTRQWRRASTGREVSTRGTVLASDDNAAGSSMRPFAEAAQARGQDIAPAIPISELVAITTPITGATYRAIYLEPADPKHKRMVRIGETGEVPKVVMNTSDKLVDLYKFGRSIEASYETLRRQRLNRVTLTIGMIANQAEIDKLAVLINVLVNGDGSPGSQATVFNLTSLDPSTQANKMTLRAYLKFRKKFKNPFAITTAIGREDATIELQLINTGSSNALLANVAANVGIGGFRQINNRLADDIGLGDTDDAPPAAIVGIDRRFAAERITEIGANITEVERFATNQTQVLVLTEVEGFAKVEREATKVLNLAA